MGELWELDVSLLAVSGSSGSWNGHDFEECIADYGPGQHIV